MIVSVNIIYDTKRSKYKLREVYQHMAKGKVKWFNDSKGFGFIVPDDGSKELFAHHSSVLGDGFKTLSEGQEVEFETEDSDKGPKAINIKKV
jgi:cold shock protein